MPEKLLKIFHKKYELSSEDERHNSEPEFLHHSNSIMLVSGDNPNEGEKKENKFMVSRRMPHSSVRS